MLIQVCFKHLRGLLQTSTWLACCADHHCPLYCQPLADDNSAWACALETYWRWASSISAYILSLICQITSEDIKNRKTDSICPVPNKPYGSCGRKALWKKNQQVQRSGAVCENRGGLPGLPVPNNPLGLRGRNATLNSNTCHVHSLVPPRKVKLTKNTCINYYGLSIIVRSRKQVWSLLSSQRHRQLFSVIADVVFVVRQIKLGNVTR